MSLSVRFNQARFIMSPVRGGTHSAPQGDLGRTLEVTVFPQWYKQVVVEWKAPAGWAGAKFHVYFSPCAGEEYTRLTSAPVSDQFFIDTTTREYSKTQNGCYVVEAILPFTNQTIRSYPATWEYTRRDRVEKMANEIQRRHYLLLSKFAGTKSYFFRRKVYGTRCPRCWDPGIEKVMDDNCPVCLGTSYEGGYYGPIPCFVQYDPDASNKQAGQQGIVEPNTLNAWTISVPAMTSMDVLVRVKDWNFYRIVGGNVTALQSKPVRQLLSLSQFSKSDIENILAERIQSPTAQKYLGNFHTEFAEKRFPQAPLDLSKENDYTWMQEQNLPILPSTGYTL